MPTQRALSSSLVDLGEGLRVFRLASVLFGIRQGQLVRRFGRRSSVPAVQLTASSGLNARMECRTSTSRSRIALADADRRLHRDQTQELQEMVLQHVLERSDAVVVPALPSSANVSSP